MTQWHYVIKNAEGDWWNNECGWVEHRNQADHYDSTSYSLPMGGRWLNVPDREAFKYVLLELREDFDGGDPWGWAIGWLFTLCGHVALHRKFEVPPEAQYRPGALGPDEGDDPLQISIVRRMSDRQLEYCIKVLIRYAECLDKHGYSY